MVETGTLSPLRQELGLFPAPPNEDGTPSWTLHDPSSNRFYLLGWTAFEILSRWQLGSSEAIVAAVNQETTLSLTDDDVMGVHAFLEQNFLLDLCTLRSCERLAALRATRRPGWTSWLLQNYLFFRIPLIRPQHFLDKVTPYVAWFYSSFFLYCVLAATLGALYFVSRQWDIFRHSFTAYRSWEGMLTLGCAIPLAKILHEFGHAFTSHRYDCKVPTMGLAMVVMTPMFYTDTNEAWKLTSRQQRLAIGAAGIMAELLLALAALWAWLLLSPGPLRGAVFVLATSTWVMTIVLNISPFMRFDGYFLLSDFLGIPNLHSRSFAFGRWWIRERIFNLGDPPPEKTSPSRRRFLVFFAYVVWFYRFFIFLAIALLVYHYFFKALGIFLFTVEIGWFILLPLYHEVSAWWNLKDRIRVNGATTRSIIFLIAIIMLLAIPWQGRVAAPAVLLAAWEQQIMTPLPSFVINEPVANLNTVNAGDVLVRLSAPDIEQRIKQMETSTSVSHWKVTQQAFDERVLSQGKVPQRRLEADTTEMAGLLEIKEQLTVRAPLSGVIVNRNDELTPGLWLSRKEPLYVIADNRKNRLDAYVGEQDLHRIAVGAQARFIPDVPEYGDVICHVTDIDRVNVPVMDEPSLASLYGGPIAARRDPQGLLVADDPLFRIRLDRCSPESVPAMRRQGVVHIDAERRSILIDALRHAYAVLIRESGL